MHDHSGQQLSARAAAECELRVAAARALAGQLPAPEPAELAPARLLPAQQRLGPGAADAQSCAACALASHRKCSSRCVDRFEPISDPPLTLHIGPCQPCVGLARRPVARHAVAGLLPATVVLHAALRSYGALFCCPEQGSDILCVASLTVLTRTAPLRRSRQNAWLPICSEA